MNRDVVLFHLQEAAEQLGKSIHGLAGSGDYGVEELEVGLGHVYHHLNTAWNGRDQSCEQFQKCTDGDFARFRKFPREEEFVYLREGDVE